MNKPDQRRAERLNARLREELDKLLGQKRETLTGEQRAVVDAFCGVDRHMSARQFQTAVEQSGESVDADTVQSVMDMLCKLGFAVRRDFGDGPRYEHLHIGEHHDHLICTHCGRVTEFTDPRLEELQAYHATRLGFRPIRHKLEIYGICRQCAAALQPTRPLSECDIGEKLTIVRIDADPQQARHLADMGMVTGAAVELLGRAGTLMVAVGQTRLGLEPSIAEHVIVASDVLEASPPPGHGPFRHGRGFGRRQRRRGSE